MQNTIFKYKRPKKPLGIYIHIPFCKNGKCLYCDFYSVEGGSKLYSAYVNALCTDIKNHAGAAQNYFVDSVYIGGGTPSVLPAPLFKKLFKALCQSFSLTSDCEVTVELNPCSVTKSLLRTLRSLPVNRLSLGIQSSDNAELAAAGRRHSFAQAQDAVELIKKYGFNNFSADIIYGLPGQSVKKLLRSVSDIAALGPSHISLYGLKLEKGTYMYANRENYIFPCEEEERGMYFEAAEALEKLSYGQYEISNFAKEGHKSRHNLKYWSCEEYLGFGCAAASYFEGWRFTCSRDIERYIAAFPQGGGGAVSAREDCGPHGGSNGEAPGEAQLAGRAEDGGFICEQYEIPYNEAVGDYIMLRLRLNEGVVLSDFRLRFGRDFDTQFKDKLEKYLATPYMRSTGKGYALTREGFLISNSIISDFLDFDAAEFITVS